MDLELGTIVGVGVVTLLLVPILCLRMKRSNQSQPKYKIGLTMMGAILLVVHVILCIKNYKEQKQNQKTCELGMKILEIIAPVALCLLFMLVRKASKGERTYKLAIVTTGGIVMFVFGAFFLWKSTMEYLPLLPDLRNIAFLDIGPRRKLTQIQCIHNTKSFDVRKTITKMVLLVAVALCVSLGT